MFGINGAVPYPYPLAPDPEGNDCWKAAQEFGAGLLLAMPTPCLNNYGFLGPQSVVAPPATYAAPIPAAVHIHGGEVPSVLDGGPDSWWTPNGIYGHGYYTRNVVALPIFWPAADTVATLPHCRTSSTRRLSWPTAYPATTVVFDVLLNDYYVTDGTACTIATIVTYPLGSVVFNQAAIGLYANNANVWTAAPPAGDAIYEIVDQTPANAGRLAYAYDFAAGPVQRQHLPDRHPRAAPDQRDVLAEHRRGLDREAFHRSGDLRLPERPGGAPVWFHDHMLGATRLNVYAGIAGGYYPTTRPDPRDRPASAWPRHERRRHVANRRDAQVNEFVAPFIIQDRMFDAKGQLFFPNVGINPEHPFWIPEFVGDTIVVNGKAWPFMNVEPRRYKFLFLNGSNARASSCTS